MSFDLQALARELASIKNPPVETWNPDFCGDIDMEIRKDGSWYYMGTPIGRPQMVKLFSTVLRRDADGRYYLVTPVEKLGIRVEDAPFLAVKAERIADTATGMPAILFETQVGDRVLAGRTHPLRIEQARDGTPRPYIHIRGRLEALISRAVFYDLVSWGEERGNQLYVSSMGEDFCLGALTL